MRVQQPRSDTFPLTWEIPAAIAASWAMVAFLALPAAQGATAWLAGGEFVWPRGRLADCAWGLMTGSPGVGLAPRGQALLPPDFFVYAAIVVVEVSLLLGAVWGLRWTWLTWSPHTQVGLATRHQAASVLGPGNLRRRAHVIRPDLARPGRWKR